MPTGLDLPRLDELLARAQNRNSEAENELFDYVLKRFDAIVRHTHRLPPRADFSGSDVVQEACLRLLERLRNESSKLFADARSFLVMSAKHLRWAMLDLLRGPKHQHLESLIRPDESQPHCEPSAATRTTPEQLELWTKFHELIDRHGLADRRGTPNSVPALVSRIVSGGDSQQVGSKRPQCQTLLALG